MAARILTPEEYAEKAKKAQASAFSSATVKEAFDTNAKGYRECCRKHDWHEGRCDVKLDFSKRGTQWVSHHKISVDAGGTGDLANCEILCVRCHNAIPK